jgi:YaiO family outer membrane protein
MAESKARSEQTVTSLSSDPKASTLSNNCWRYTGSFLATAATVIDHKLIIMGNCEVGPNSSVTDDLKVHGHLTLRGRTSVEGNIWSTRQINLGPHCSVTGLIYAGESLAIGEHCQLGWAQQATAIYSVGPLEVMPGSIIFGKIASGAGVKVVCRQGAIQVAAARRRIAIVATQLLLALIGSASGFGQPSSGPRTGDSPITKPLIAARVEIGSSAITLSSTGPTYFGPELRFSTHFRKLTTVADWNMKASLAGTQECIALMTYYDWSKAIYTTQSVSVGYRKPAVLFPRFRADARINYKLPPTRRTIIGVGITNVRYGSFASAEVYNTGIIAYRKSLIVSADSFINVSHPGHLASASGRVAGQIGREGHQWIIIAGGGGNELYRISAPFRDEFRALSATLEAGYRRWLSRRGGLVIRGLIQRKLGYYTRSEIGVGVFIEL